MIKLRTFFYCLNKSVTSPKYYSDILKTKNLFTIKYYVFLALSAALITSIVTGVRMFPIAKRESINFLEQVKTLYPDDLKITVRDGQWSTNKSEPLIIPFPKTSGSEFGGFENIVVFYKLGTLDDLKIFKTLVLVNEANVITTDPSGTITSKPIKNFKDMEIDAESMNKFSYTILTITPYALLVVIAIGSVFFYLFANLNIIFFVGVAIYFYAKSNKRNLKFVEALRIATHTMTIPIILQVIINSAGITLPSSYWFFVLNLILALIITMKLPAGELETKTPPQLNTQN